MSYMKWPKYGEWCKQNVIETIRKQKINETEAYLEDVVFAQACSCPINTD